MRIAFKTFGCKANSVDTDFLQMEALRRGYDIVEDTLSADAYVINSCTVTSHADRDARAQASRFKRLNPEALVAVVGCYAQVAKEELLNLPEVDFVVGTAEKIRILDHFSRRWEGGEVNKDQVLSTSGFLPEEFRGSRYARASVKIQDGCNFKCSFCIIPQARGRSRSLSSEAVLSQISEAARQGFGEIVLTGIHLAHYGWDLNSDLMKLLKEIFAQPGGPRIRLSTLDPFEVPDELVAWLGEEPRLCPHFHIALQSGDDSVLRRMRRIYKAHEFVDATTRLYRRDPNVFIGVDVIVGFPGESDAAFEQTVKCLEASPWTKLHVFPFSVRKGTQAETLDEKVPAAVIAERSRVLRELSHRRYFQFLNSQLGLTKEVILERPERDGRWRGHTENYIPTLSVVPAGETKDRIRVRLESLEGERVVAEPLTVSRSEVSASNGSN